MSKNEQVKQLLFGSLAGAIGWTATEYISHRWLLHGPLGRMHRAHHRDPLATNPFARAGGHLAIAAVAAVSAAVMIRVRPAFRVGATAAAACWSGGYSTYELLHWRAHHRPARTDYGRRLRERHMRHHFGAPQANLGVTIGWWDTIAGTQAAPQRG